MRSFAPWAMYSLTDCTACGPHIRTPVSLPSITMAWVPCWPQLTLPRWHLRGSWSLKSPDSFPSLMFGVSQACLSACKGAVKGWLLDAVQRGGAF